MLIGFISLLLWCTAVSADEKDAEKYLNDMGLRRLSSHFSLPEEAKLGKQVRAARKLKKKITSAQREVSVWQKTVDDKQKLIIAYLQKRRELRMQLARAPSAKVHNRIVSMMNELVDRIMLMQQSGEAEKSLKNVRVALNEASEKYIEYLLETRKMYNNVKEKYEDLTTIPKVKLAVEHYSKAVGKTYRLGPGPGFLSLGRRLKKMEDTVLSEEIQLSKGSGGLWYVPVTFNGKHTQEMAIDTGAAIITMPWKTATAVGMTPTEDDPAVQLRLADGSVVDGRRKLADSVRVGKFIAKNVDCAVMPEHLPGAAPLLGLSFFKHFTYKIDTAGSKLIMSKIKLGGTP